MNWIRIATGIKNDPRIAGMAQQLQLDVPTVVGLVVSTLCELPEHARDGNLIDVPTLAIERWAGWDGEREAYAYAFRTWMCTDEGIVASWERHNGAAMREAEAARERAKQWRDDKRKKQDEPDANGKRTKSVRRTYASTANAERTPLRNGTERELTTAPSSDAAVVRGGAADWVPLHFPDQAHQQAVAGYIRAHQFPDALRATLTAIASGQGAPNGQPVPWATIGQAVVEMQSAGARFSASALRGFIGRLCKASADVTWDDIFRSASAPEASHVA